MGYPRASRVVDRRRQTRAYLVKRKLVLGIGYARARLGRAVPELFVRGIDRAIENNLAVFEIIRETLGVATVADSSKSYLKGIALYAHAPENVRILLLTRDGRGGLWSHMKRGVPRHRAIREWRNQYTRALPLLARHVPAERLLRVRYEDLTSEPARELARICKFVGVPFEPAMLEFRDHVHHATNGNDIRLRGSSELEPDVQWMSRLTQDDLDYFDRRAGRLNRALGYR